MNRDEWLALVGPTVALLGPIAARYGFSAGDLTAFLTGAAGIAWTVYNHWNMKKVPEDARVVAPVAKP